MGPEGELVCSYDKMRAYLVHGVRLPVGVCAEPIAQTCASLETAPSRITLHAAILCARSVLTGSRLG